MIKYSEADESSLLSASVLVIDSIGLLSSLYQYGDIAYVGGGFGKGIHNILEPATFGLPVIFGPNHKKFREALDLKKHGGAFTIDGYHSLKDLMHRFLKNPYKISKAGKISRQYVENNTGGTARILLYVYDE
jgi:3-deoxy-D-manno-octulosonic-acid transferase